jgi:hypothetical protein
VSRYLITTDQGGPLYFRESLREAEQFQRDWQAELGPQPRVLVSCCPDVEPPEDPWRVVREAFAFIQNECSIGEEAEAALERARRAFESLATRYELD